jgi:hypothetical protein
MNEGRVQAVHRWAIAGSSSAARLLRSVCSTSGCLYPQWNPQSGTRNGTRNDLGLVRIFKYLAATPRPVSC